MFKHRGAYPITPSNTHILSLITSLSKPTLVANIGWCATYSETRFPRWEIVPKVVAVDEMDFDLDEETYP